VKNRNFLNLMRLMKHGVGRASIFICLLLGKGPEREREGGVWRFCGSFLWERVKQASTSLAVTSLLSEWGEWELTSTSGQFTARVTIAIIKHIPITEHFSIFKSYLNRIERFLCRWMCNLEAYKCSLSVRSKRVTQETEEEDKP